jgi:hypothetical protein
LIHAYSYHTVPVEEGGRVIGNKIEIHPRESMIIRRIFDEARSGRSFAAIAAGLNRDRIPSPRVGSKYKCFGWGKVDDPRDPVQRALCGRVAVQGAPVGEGARHQPAATAVARLLEPKAALAELAEQASRPFRLPSNDEVMALATHLEGRLTDDPEVGRATLRRWLSDGVIRVDQSPDGPIAETELLPLMVLIDGAEKGGRKSGGGSGAAGGRKLKSVEMVASLPNGESTPSRRAMIREPPGATVRE